MSSKRTVDELNRIQGGHAAWLMTNPGVKGSMIGLDEHGDPQIVIDVHENIISPESRAAIIDRFATAGAGQIAFKDFGIARACNEDATQGPT